MSEDYPRAIQIFSGTLHMTEGGRAIELGEIQRKP